MRKTGLSFTPQVSHYQQSRIELTSTPDPSGTYIRYDAKGMGAADEMILTLMKDKYNKEMSLEECEKLGVSILKEVM